MSKFNHAYDIGFEVISETKDGSDVTADMLREALQARIAQLDHNGDIAWLAACALFDTFETDPEQQDALAVLRKRYLGTDLDSRRALAEERRRADHEQELHDEGRLKDGD
jgi:hypothetical protein